MSIARPPALVDSLWNNLCTTYGVYYDTLRELVDAVLAAGHPRAKKEQKALRNRAAGALALLKLDTFSLNGVRITLVDAPTMVVDGIVVVTGASKIRVTMNHEDLLAAAVIAQHAKNALQPSTLKQPRHPMRTVIDLAEERARRIAMQKAV